MNDTWRLFRDRGRPLSTAEGLAVDDTLPRSVEEQGSPPILHLYSFVPSAIVGKYQDIEAALDLDRCKTRGIEYNRRSTGGGTVIMGPDVVSLGLGINIDHPGLGGGGVAGVFSSLSKALSLGLERLGIRASFRPKNDLEVEGRKIAGLSAASEAGKSLLFHTSLLVDFDLELMPDIMRTPAAKLSDKGYNCFSRRMTTVRREAGKNISVDEVIDAIAEAFEEHFSVRLRQDRPDTWERSTVCHLMENRYTQPDWIFSHKHPRSRMGVGRLKTPGGLLEIYLSLAGASIENVVITGDFFSTTEDVNLLESALRWTTAQERRISENLRKVWRKDMIYGVDVPTLTKAVLLAKENQVRL
ncbi:MAG: lipoyl protein ligase domain-containing protein [Desulfobacteraceae bacterium]